MSMSMIIYYNYEFKNNKKMKKSEKMDVRGNWRRMESEG